MLFLAAEVVSSWPPPPPAPFPAAAAISRNPRSSRSWLPPPPLILLALPDATFITVQAAFSSFPVVVVAVFLSSADCHHLSVPPVQPA
jgi:hypothetical protein